VSDPLEILRRARTIALVGASPDPSRPSHSVRRYLLRAGYRVLPVTPAAAEVHGIRCVPSLLDLEEPVDLVDVVRRTEHCPAHAREAVEIGAGALWLQLGIVSREARAIAEGAGLDDVENACTAALHARHLRTDAA
jgi:predicted CoA-binding protein